MTEIFEDGGMFEYREAWSRRQEKHDEEKEFFGDLAVVSHPSFDEGNGVVLHVYDIVKDEFAGKVSLNHDCTVEATCIPRYQARIAAVVTHIAHRFMF
jgi:hypothetical protein